MNTIHVNNETLRLLFTTKYPISVPLCEPKNHGHFRPYTHQYMIYCTNQHINSPNSPYIATDCAERAPKILTFWSQDLGPIKRPLTASINSSINKVLKQRVNPSRIKPLPQEVCRNSLKPEPTRRPLCVEQLSFLLRRISTIGSPGILERSDSLSH